MATVPFRDFGDACGEMDRLFAEMPGLRRGGPGGGMTLRVPGSPPWTPSPGKGGLVIREEKAGGTLQGGSLTVSRERKASHEQNSGGYHIRECRHETFRVGMSLPKGMRQEQIKAHSDA